VLGASGGVSCERVLRGSGGVSVLCLARCLRGAAGVESRDLSAHEVRVNIHHPHLCRHTLRLFF
jgi:hypothetical protein